jgi:UDP-glucose 4-epimerase
MAGETILVAGGAGYVGAHTCLALAEAGYTPVVFDNLSNGHEHFVQWGPLEIGDINDASALDAVFKRHRPAAVLHFAALIEVGISMREPGAFYRNNVAGALNLISAAQRAGVAGLVFSSTCAIYGVPERVPLVEAHPVAPLNPYGRSKAMVEQILLDLSDLEGFRSVCLRYFNAAGADPSGRIGEAHEPETHAIPLAIEAALGQRDGFSIFGTDYETRDGTAVRDYVHVLDLADAHIRAVRHILDGGASKAINLGTGTGTTVIELLDTIKSVSGRDFPVTISPRRAGDSPILVADNSYARAVLGWQPQRDLNTIVTDAWRWHSARNVLQITSR